MNFRHIKKLGEVAKKAASLSTYRYKLGAVLFKKNKILSIGYNNVKTHPDLIKYFQHGTIHAECDCILHCTKPEKIKGSSIVISRTAKNGKPALAKPCPMCIQLLHDHAIDGVYWTKAEWPWWDYAKVEDLYKGIDKKKAFATNGK